MLFRRKYELSEINVDQDWITSDAWRTWESPRNFVAGESHYRPALRRLTGKPRSGGYLTPVEVHCIREPRNQYDGNAFRVEVNGEHVGYLARHIALQLAGPLDKARCSTFSVCGILRGGQKTGEDVGVHVWLNRRLSPGPDLKLADDAMDVTWPPHNHEGAHCSNDEGD
jgi:hypothetical protein